MTEEELDNLASAYMDGEATPEEVARVEADPVLLHRVAIFRSVSATVSGTIAPAPVSPDDRQAQIAAAMAGFGASDSGDVIDLSQRRQPVVQSDRSPLSQQSTPETRTSTESMQVKRRSALPAWLGAAALVVVAMGGFAYLVNAAKTESLTTAVEGQGEAIGSTDDADDTVDAAEYDSGAVATLEPSAADENYDLDKEESSADSYEAAEDSVGSGVTVTTGLGATAMSLFEMESVDLISLAEDPTVPWQLPLEQYCDQPTGVSVVGRLAAVLGVAVDGQRFEVLLYTEDGEVGSVVDGRTLLLVDTNCEVVDSNI